MHESGLVKSLIHEVERVARQYRGPKVLSVRVRLGALCPFSESHLREHFLIEARGTVAGHADLVIERGTDPTDLFAQDVCLVSLQVEDILRTTVQAASANRKLVVKVVSETGKRK